MASGSRDWRALLGWLGGRQTFEDVPPKPTVSPAPRDALGRVLVARTRPRGDLHAAVGRVLDSLAWHGPLLSQDDTPLVLPRFGAGPSPLSTAPDFLEATIAALRGAGAGYIRVLDARSSAQPEPRDLAETCERAGCELVDVREGPWVRVTVGGGLGRVLVPRVAYEAEKLVLLPSPLVNPVTRFAMALALGQELLHARDRGALSRVRQEELLVELNIALRPWLALMDARRALVSDEGPVTREPGYVLASGDPVALDVAALRLLKGYPAKNRLDLPVWQFPQVTAAIRLGLGATREDDVYLLER
ncbi:MAG: DUF362 domain-containing protein [Chloroflexota bacterium]|nr:DUF362 domain-containing protein [Chloroflexota bacterium]